MKRLLLVGVAALTMFTVTPTATEAAKAFTDVEENTELDKAVKDYVEKGVIGGYADGTFRPSNPVTRAQAAKILAGAFELNLKNVKNPRFMDVPVTHPNYKYIAALANAGITQGVNNRFNPDAPVTRAQIAKMLVVGAKLQLQPVKDGRTYFADVDVKNSLADYIHTMYKIGFVKGVKPSFYAPERVLTRGQFMMMLHRVQTSTAVTDTKLVKLIEQDKVASYKMRDGNTLYAVQKTGYPFVEAGKRYFSGEIEWYVVEPRQLNGYLVANTEGQEVTVNLSKMPVTNGRLDLGKRAVLTLFENEETPMITAHRWVYDNGYMVKQPTVMMSTYQPKTLGVSEYSYYFYNRHLGQWQFIIEKWDNTKKQFVTGSIKNYAASDKNAQQLVDSWDR